MRLVQLVEGRRDDHRKDVFIEQPPRERAEEATLRALRLRGWVAIAAKHGDLAAVLEHESLDVDGVAVAVLTHPTRKARHLAASIRAQMLDTHDALSELP